MIRGNDERLRRRTTRLYRLTCTHVLYTRILMAHLDAFAGNVSIAWALVELEPVRVEFQVALLPCLQKRAAELQHLSLDDAVSDLSVSHAAYTYKYEPQR